MEILQTLGINWSLLLAQIINFGIIALILAKFVYKPVLRVIDDRREATKRAMQDVKDIEQQKRDSESLRLEQLRALEDESKQILEKARHHAQVIQEEMINKAQHEATMVLERARKQLEQERQDALVSLQGVAGSMIVRMTEKILEREFGPGDQKRLLETVQKELPGMLK